MSESEQEIGRAPASWIRRNAWGGVAAVAFGGAALGGALGGYRLMAYFRSVAESGESAAGSAATALRAAMVSGAGAVDLAALLLALCFARALFETRGARPVSSPLGHAGFCAVGTALALVPPALLWRSSVNAVRVLGGETLSAGAVAEASARLSTLILATMVSGCVALLLLAAAFAMSSLRPGVSPERRGLAALATWAASVTLFACLAIACHRHLAHLERLSIQGGV